MNQLELINIGKEYIEELLHVRVTTMPYKITELSDFFEEFLPSFYTPSLKKEYIQQLLQSYPAGVITHLIDPLDINYLLFPYEDDQLLIIGPYITHSPTSQYCDDLLKEHKISKQYAIAFNLFYQTFKVCLNSTIYSAIFILVKRLLNLDNNPTIYPINLTSSIIKDFSFIEETENSGPSKQMIEKRYDAEKLFLVDIYNGDANSALKHYLDFRHLIGYLQRADTPLRSEKNLFYTLNTHRRRTDQKAGVHPLYLDNISGNFARLAEQCNNLDDLEDLEHYMLPAYCRLVQQQSLKNHSPSVRNVLIYIKHNLTENMTLNSLALECNVSPSYLSKLFNSEVGESIPNYINHLRADRAARLLETTDQSIKSICTQMGILDTNYFTKIFKRYYHLSPSEYRQKSKPIF